MAKEISMVCLRRLPVEVFNQRIIPYTYRKQIPALLADIRDWKQYQDKVYKVVHEQMRVLDIPILEEGVTLHTMLLCCLCTFIEFSLFPLHFESYKHRRLGYYRLLTRTGSTLFGEAESEANCRDTIRRTPISPAWQKTIHSILTINHDMNYVRFTQEQLRTKINLLLGAMTPKERANYIDYLHMLIHTGRMGY